jgi:shikimate dehydrogenase
VAHLRSPAMMTAAFEALGIDATYELRDTAPGALEATLAALWEGGYLGANVTVPWKVAARGALAQVDEVAERCGAVNTLLRGDRGFVGTNTDAAGFARAIAEAGASLSGQRVVVLGAGGAARAVAFAAERGGAESVTVLARDPTRARGLGRVPGFGSDAARAAVHGASLLVQATPCGMTGGPPGDAIVDAVDLSRCARGAFAVDLVYAPAETPWMRAARGHGARVLDGVGIAMLVHQGAEAFERWFRRDAPVRAMRGALRP